MIEFGKADQSFAAAGGEAGIHKLVDCFYDIMSSDAAYATIWKWHPKDKPGADRRPGSKDKQLARDKLSAFLSGWLGGPRRFQEEFGSISIPAAHAHLAVTEVERDLWLACMQKAVAQQGYTAEFAEYLLRALAVPAERIRLVCEPRGG